MILNRSNKDQSGGLGFVEFCQEPLFRGISRKHYASTAKARRDSLPQRDARARLGLPGKASAMVPRSLPLYCMRGIAVRNKRGWCACGRRKISQLFAERFLHGGFGLVYTIRPLALEETLLDMCVVVIVMVALVKCFGL